MSATPRRLESWAWEVVDASRARVRATLDVSGAHSLNEEPLVGASYAPPETCARYDPTRDLLLGGHLEVTNSANRELPEILVDLEFVGDISVVADFVDAPVCLDDGFLGAMWSDVPAAGGGFLDLWVIVHDGLSGESSTRPAPGLRVSLPAAGSWKVVSGPAWRDRTILLADFVTDRA